MNKFSFKDPNECKESIELFKHKKYQSVKTIIKFAADKNDISKLCKLRTPLKKNKKTKNELNIKEIDNYLENQQKHKFYKIHDKNSFLNTLKYLFYKIGCGIFVQIKQGKLEMFYPFYNLEYRNNWNLKFNNADTFEDYIKKKKPDDYNFNLKTWTMNGCLVNNWKKGQINDARWAENYDMLQTLCKNRNIQNVEFFINYRDFPVLNRKLHEPNFFIFDKKNQKMTDYKYKTYLPILSCYSSPLYADYMIPSYTEWKMITKKYFPNNSKFNCDNKQIHVKKIEWSNKVSTAQFRGSATGCGITPETNQRLHIASISKKWQSDNRYNEKNQVDGIPFLNAGIVGYNNRDKKDIGKPIDFINIKKLNIHKSNYLTRDEQQKFKYVVYIDGHVAAERLIFEMNSGSVILKVESLYNWMQWFHVLLKPYIHYIPVKADLSDLAEKIQWCKTNDDKCYQITKNAANLFTQINNKHFILDYMTTMLSNFN